MGGEGNKRAERKGRQGLRRLQKMSPREDKGGRSRRSRERRRRMGVRAEELRALRTWKSTSGKRRGFSEAARSRAPGVHVAVMYYGTIFLTACLALSGYGSVAVCFTIPYSRMGDRHMSKNTENILGDRAIKTNHMSVKQFCHMF